MRTDTAAIIASVGQSCTTHRAVKNATTGQYAYGAAYRTDTIAIEPASEGMVIASDAPAGSLWRLIAPWRSDVAAFQRSDLVKATDGRKFVITGVEPYLNHTALTATTEDVPSFTAP